MRKIMFLILVIFLISCTSVRLDETKEKAEKKIENKTEMVKGELEETEDKLKTTIDKITTSPYDTPSTVRKRIIKATEVEGFGDVI